MADNNPNQVLTIRQVREYVSDYAPNNTLIDGVEFSDTYISLCMDLAIDSYNMMSPMTAYNQATFPSSGVLLLGTLWKMFGGKAALYARNRLDYSDGGLQVSLESRIQDYNALASQFQTQFTTAAQALKVNINMAEGYGSVSSDYSMFPLW
jgi:hypothetical protein